MVRVDATARAEVVLCGPCVEAVRRERVLPLQDAEPLEGYGAHHGTLAPTHGTGASAYVDQAIGQVQLQDHCTTVATGAVPLQNASAANFMDWAYRHKSPRRRPRRIGMRNLGRNSVEDTNGGDRKKCNLHAHGLAKRARQEDRSQSKEQQG